MYREPDEMMVRKGTAYVERAHGLTQFRSDVSPYIETAIAATEEDLAVTALVAGVMATDGADGYYARKGAALLGVPPSEEGAIKDPEADKQLANVIMRGLIARWCRQRDFGSAAIMAANLAASHWRDKRMSENRVVVTESHLNPQMLKAIPTNKLKTALQMKAGLVAMSSNKGRTRRRALWTFTAGTLTGIAGEYQYRRNVQKLLKDSA